MIYDGADKAMKEMNRANLKAFNRLKLAKWDELNVIREVNGVYNDSTNLAKRKYYEIAIEAYIVALYELQYSPVLAHRMADDTITAMWILGMLEDVDPVTLYAFLPEKDRKAQRLIEALSVALDKPNEIDKALRYWTVQVGQYADNSVYNARLQAFKDAGLKKVMWVTQEDERVCGTCDELDRMVFDIDKVPKTPHWHCRCYVVPA